MRKSILHIAAHLGGGAGKAISGLAAGLKEYYNNKVILLEKPEQDRYVRLCEEQDIEVVITRDATLMKSMIEEADYVIFSWWGHPLSLEAFKVLSVTEARVFLWSHINGLYYPFISPEYIGLFDGAMFTSKCSYENEKWTESQRKELINSTEIVYGIGDFKPAEFLVKTNYNIKDVCRIGYSGTVNYNKMNAKFPEVCLKIKRRLPSAEFYLYGKYDDETYESFIRYDDVLRDCVHFEGFVDDLDKRLTELDVYCYPLNSVNFATTENALLEAMAAGLPVVVLNNPPERNIIRHHVDGMIANDVEAMADYVVALCKDRLAAKRLGKNARMSTIERYDCHVNARACAQYMESFVGADKKIHDFVSVLGETAADNFLYFSNMTLEEYKDRIEKCVLHDIFKGDSKGSVKHYLKYYEDDVLKQLCC